MILPQIVSQYIGASVGVLKSQHTINVMGVPHTMDMYELVEGDPTIMAIQNGVAPLTLRVWLPDTIGTMDLRGDRVNVVVEENELGDFTVTKIYLG